MTWQKLDIAYLINMGGAAIALYFITDRPAYSFLLFFLPAAIGNEIAWILVARDSARMGK